MVEKQGNIMKSLSVSTLMLCFLLFSELIAAYFFRLKGVFIVPAIFFVIVYLIVIVNKPAVALVTLFVTNYFIMGFTRYIPDAPLGLVMDFLILLTFVAIFLHMSGGKIPWKNAANVLTLCSGIWMFYSFLQLFNPLSPSREAWFYAVRGISFHFFTVSVLTAILLDKYKYLKLLINLWAVFTWIAVAKVLMQIYWGFDYAEQRWLDTGGASTHLIITGTRYFSFFTDAGEFGATMGQAFVAFVVLALGKGSARMKVFYLLTGLVGAYGMMASGTRGAIAVPAIGFLLYLILSKKTKIFFAGVVCMIGAYILLNHTYIGHQYNMVRRMRTAFDRNDKSYQVRVANQEKLKYYLADKPFGGGIGSAGDWGLRFSPNTFLAQTPTDSWYVAIWAEQGIIGLILYIALMTIIFFKACQIVLFKIKSQLLQNRLSALIASSAGIMAAAYGNSIVGQFPVGIIMYMGFAFVFVGQIIDRQMEDHG
ncbi:O-antigen ligase family protein [Coprobacter sp.]